MNESYKQNVGKFKVGDVVSGYYKGLFKIVEIDTTSHSSSGELHVCASFNPVTKKLGKAQRCWCSSYTVSGQEYLAAQIKSCSQKLSTLQLQLEKLNG